MEDALVESLPAAVFSQPNHAGVLLDKPKTKTAGGTPGHCRKPQTDSLQRHPVCVVGMGLWRCTTVARTTTSDLEESDDETVPLVAVAFRRAAIFPLPLKAR
jgi:hypothetical protein